MAIPYSTARALGALLSITKIMKSIQSDIRDNVDKIKNSDIDQSIEDLEKIVNYMDITISDIKNITNDIISKFK